VVRLHLLNLVFLVENLRFLRKKVIKQVVEDGGNLGMERRDVSFGEACCQAFRSDRSASCFSPMTWRFEGRVNAGTLGGGGCVGRVLGVGHDVVVVAVDVVVGVVGVVVSCWRLVQRNSGLVDGEE
jgi:hypothetical protein